MTKPGEVYKVDLGYGGKIRMMVVVSRYDMDAPRSLSLCVPITSAYRDSQYEVPLASASFLRTQSYANVQGLQAVQDHELIGPIGMVYGSVFEAIKSALKFPWNSNNVAEQTTEVI